MSATDPFKEWLKTDTGRACNDWYSLRFSKEPQKYLENRLYHAYSAGTCEEYKHHKTHQLTIDWYERKKRDADKLIKEMKITIEQLESEKQKAKVMIEMMKR